MPTLQLTPEELKKYFSNSYFHKGYDVSTKMYLANKVHADGDYPKAMIEERRPSESEAVKAYREKIWQPITKPEWGKVLIALNKIRRSSDWSIRFDATKEPPALAGRSLADYLTTGLPEYTSLTNWLFAVALPAYAKDSNALYVVMPIREDRAVTDLVRPQPIIFYSDQIIEYKPNDFAVLKSTDKVEYGVTGAKVWGDVYYIVDTQKIQRYEQIDGSRKMLLAWEYDHNIGQFPGDKLKGFVKNTLDGQTIFESRLSGVLPSFNEAAREYSDLQAGVVQHLYKERWEYAGDNCPSCKGKGERSYPYSGMCTCKECGGSGVKKRNPYATLYVKPQALPGEAEKLPIPPAGYIENNPEIIKLQSERVKEHKFDGLAAINMQFLMQSPLNVSGLKTEVDKDELNTFVNACAEDIVAIADGVAYFTNELRYMDVLAPEKRLEQLPVINVPEKFDILSADYLEAGLQKAMTNKISPVLINAMTIEYANKKFSSDPAVRDRTELIIKLDPLAGVSDDDKLVRAENNWISRESVTISSNIQEFIDRAIDEKGDAFFALKLIEKKALMKQYATELINSTGTIKTVELDPTPA